MSKLDAITEKWFMNEWVLLPLGKKREYKREIKDLLLEFIDENAKLNDIYGDDDRNNYGYNEIQVRDATNYIQRKLRSKVQEL